MSQFFADLVCDPIDFDTSGYKEVMQSQVMLGSTYGQTVLVIETLVEDWVESYQDLMTDTFKNDLAYMNFTTWFSQEYRDRFISTFRDNVDDRFMTEVLGLHSLVLTMAESLQAVVTYVRLQMFSMCDVGTAGDTDNLVTFEDYQKLLSTYHGLWLLPIIARCLRKRLQLDKK